MEALSNTILSSLKKQTNWYVITGGPSSGKTTTVNLLKERGYITTFEHARHYMDTQRVSGKTAAQGHAYYYKIIFDGRVNTDKEYTLGLRYFISRTFSISTQYDSDYGAGAGISIRY